VDRADGGLRGAVGGPAMIIVSGRLFLGSASHHVIASSGPG
jgi:hypothetical protein